MDMTRKNRWRKRSIRYDNAVLDLGDAGNRQADMTWMRRRANGINQTRMSDVDFLFLPNGGSRIDDRLTALHVTRCRIFPAVGHLHRVHGRFRNTQPDDLAGGVLRNIDCRRWRAVRREIEHRTVGKNPPAIAQRKSALLADILVNLDFRKTPGIRRGKPDTFIQQMLRIAVALL